MRQIGTNSVIAVLLALAPGTRQMQAATVDQRLGITYRMDDEEMGIRYLEPEAWNVSSTNKKMTIAPTIRIPNDLLYQSLKGEIVVEARTLSVPLTAEQMHAKFLNDYTLEHGGILDWYTPGMDLRGSGAVFIGGREGRSFDFTSRIISQPGISRVIYIPLDRTLYTFRVTMMGKTADDAAYGFEQFLEKFEWFTGNVEFIGHERAIQEPSKEPEQPIAAAAQPFTDINESHAQGKAIAWVRDRGIVAGYPDGTFRPERTINRAEFTKIIVGATHDVAQINQCPALSSVSPFPDVSADDWFMPYTCSARRFGIMDGYPDGTFRPAQEINTAEASKIIVKAFQLSAESSADSREWFRPSMDALGALGALPSSAQDPAHLLTRGEMAEVIYGVKRDGTQPEGP